MGEGIDGTKRLGEGGSVNIGRAICIGHLPYRLTLLEGGESRDLDERGKGTVRWEGPNISYSRNGSKEPLIYPKYGARVVS